jgi:hypothetical protein
VADLRVRLAPPQPGAEPREAELLVLAQPPIPAGLAALGEQRIEGRGVGLRGLEALDVRAAGLPLRLVRRRPGRLDGRVDVLQHRRAQAVEAGAERIGLDAPDAIGHEGQVLRHEALGVGAVRAEVREVDLLGRRGRAALLREALGEQGQVLAPVERAVHEMAPALSRSAGERAEIRQVVRAHGERVDELAAERDEHERAGPARCAVQPGGGGAGEDEGRGIERQQVAVPDVEVRAQRGAAHDDDEQQQRRGLEQQAASRRARRAADGRAAGQRRGDRERQQQQLGGRGLVPGRAQEEVREADRAVPAVEEGVARAAVRQHEAQAVEPGSGSSRRSRIQTTARTLADGSRLDVRPPAPVERLRRRLALGLHREAEAVAGPEAAPHAGGQHERQAEQRGGAGPPGQLAARGDPPHRQRPPRERAQREHRGGHGEHE